MRIFAISNMRHFVERFAKKNNIPPCDITHVEKFMDIAGVEEGFTYVKLGQWWNLKDFNRINTVIIMKKGVKYDN